MIKDIFTAVREGDLSAAKALLVSDSSLGRQVDRSGNTPLHYAPTVEMAELLIVHGAEVNAKGHLHSTPLHDAAQNARPDLVRVLLAHGADVHAKRDGQWTPLDCAPPSPNATDRLEVAKLLIAAGSPIEAGVTRKTRLMRALERRDDLLARHLIHCGASVTARDSNGKTPLHHLCLQERRYVGKVRQQWFDDLFINLLDAGADVNAADQSGATPLHIAATHESSFLAEILVSAGADARLRNRWGATPLTVARTINRPDTVKFLRKRMIELGTDPSETEVLPLEVFLNPVTGEAMTTSRQGALQKWCDTGAMPKLLACSEIDYLDWLDPLHDRSVDIAIAPDGETFLIAASYVDTIATCRWSDMGCDSKIDYERDDGTGFSISPNGRWFAVAKAETLLLFDRTSHNVVSEVPAGERTGPIVFDEETEIVATACSYQGGANVRVDAINQNGELTPLYVVWLSDRGTPDAFFVDTVSGVAINRVENLLAIFATSRIYHDLNPAGWSGYMAVCDLQTGKRLWTRSIDMGFGDDVLFLNANEVTCSAASDALIVFDAMTGVEVRRMPLGHDRGIRSFALDRQRKRLWTVSGDSRIVIYDL